MSDLKKAVVKLAHKKPELRAHLLPLLKKAAGKKLDYHKEVYELRQNYQKAIAQAMGDSLRKQGYKHFRTGNGWVSFQPGKEEGHGMEVHISISMADDDEVRASVEQAGRRKSIQFHVSEGDSEAMAEKFLTRILAAIVPYTPTT